MALQFLIMLECFLFSQLSLQLVIMLCYSRQELLSLRKPEEGIRRQLTSDTFNRIKDYHILAVSPTKRGCRSGRHVKDFNNTKAKSGLQIKFCLLNAQSVCNKTALIMDFILEQRVDICAITETWLSADPDRHKMVIGELSPDGYDFLHIPRPSMGGGVAIMYKVPIRCARNYAFKATSFESIIADITINWQYMSKTCCVIQTTSIIYK